ncbi:MAG: hypothetical protein ACRDIX_03125 [Actinomycetota bacterium]
MARWKLALLIASSLFFLGFVLSRGPAFGLLLLALSWLGLCAATLRWGYDSRDGRDWDERPERPRSPEIQLPRLPGEKLSREDRGDRP